MTRPTPRRAGTVAGLAALVLTACGPDGPDAYTAPPTSVPPPTLAPATTEPPPTTEPTGVTTVPEPEPPPETFPPNGDTFRIRSLDNTFFPGEVRIVAGTEVLWTNNGRDDHDVLPVDDDEEWGVVRSDFSPGKEYRHVFDTPGEYPYYCSLHGNKQAGMVGTLVVTAPDEA